MSQLEAPPQERTRASARYVRVAPNKVRLLTRGLRGMPVDRARRLLTVSDKGAAQPLLKTLNSAVANAEHNLDPSYDAEELIITSATVDEGPTLKRWRPRAMGRASRIRKRTSHITVGVGTPASAERHAGQG